VEKVLTQEEIDAMFRVAQGRRAGVEDHTNVLYWNYQQSGQINNEQVRAISVLHEGFARNLARSLGAYLRVIFEANLVSVEQLAYREFLSRIPDMAYCASFQLKPINAIAALELDLALAFPIIDLLLGGVGSGDSQVREITDIEEEILAGVVKILCNELAVTWQPLGLTFEFEDRQQPRQMQRLLPPTEKALGLSFEIRMAESRGMLNLVFPAVVSNALLRKLSNDWSANRRRGPQDQIQRIHERALDFPFEVELGAQQLALRMSALLDLKAGDVLPFTKRIESPSSLLVAGLGLFTAVPVRNNGRIAARVVDHLPITPEQKRNLK
jgi:flagellar motor switch protein FliM